MPNAALRYFPARELVRPEDRKLLEGFQQPDEKDDDVKSTRSAEEVAESRRSRNRRHVWAADGLFVRAIEVVSGLNDNRFTEIVSGDLDAGQKLVTGIQAKE